MTKKINFQRRPYKGIIQAVANKCKVGRDAARRAWFYAENAIALTDNEKKIVREFERQIAKVER